MATVPDAFEVRKVKGLRAPIKGVTVYPHKAEITRVLTFSPEMKGLHEVELTGLPGRYYVEEQSLAVKGSGLCTILDFSFSNPSNENTAEEERLKAKKREEMQLAKDAKMEALQEKHARLARQSSRIERLIQLTDKVADRAVSGLPPCSTFPILGPGTAARDAAATAAAATGAAAPGSMDISGVSEALDWWEKKAADLDEQYQRVAAEGKRVRHAAAELEQEHAADVVASTEQRPGGFLFGIDKQQSQGRMEGRVLVTIDVDAPLSPIELEVSYMTPGATWSPSYDLKVDTETDSVTCTYYGRVSQNTTEDWKGVALKLSTVEPSVKNTPASLAAKTVSFKPTFQAGKLQPYGEESPLIYFTYRLGTCENDRSCYEKGLKVDIHNSTAALSSSCLPSQSKGRSRKSGFSFGGASGFGSASPGSAQSGGGFGVPGPPPSAPPPPPEAKSAVAQVECGSGSMGAVTFVVAKPANIKSNGETKKLSVAVLQLSAEVVHYIVPSREPAAYMQAKATNSTDYLLLASDAVSVFFDNSFVAKTSLNSVSPGDSFQTFLGVDPAVKVEFAPIRKMNKNKGLFGNVDRVSHCCSTSISNKKKVPITCVVVEALPRSTDESIKVHLQQPAPAKVTKIPAAITAEKLVDMALDMFGVAGEGGRDGKDKDGDNGATASKAAIKSVATDVAGVAKGVMDHMAWVVNIAPQEDISVPLEYTVEWPMDKDIVFGG
ncbi:unnamed protein product [Scytosiphon promiscuus]